MKQVQNHNNEYAAENRGSMMQSARSDGKWSQSVYMNIHTNNAMDQAIDLIEEDINEDMALTNDDRQDSSADETEDP